jgi:glycosyltransferase involved in cell wall biosynthesis
VRPLRVLQVTSYYGAAYGYGGIPRVAAALCAALARRGHHVAVCTTDACDAGSRLTTPNGPGPRLRAWPPRRVQDGVEIRVFPNLSNRLAWHLQFFSPIGLRAWLRERASEFDLAHIHGHHHLPGAIAAAELSRVGIPYLVAPNGTAPRIERRRLAKALFDHSVGRHVLRGARWVIAVSEAERAQLEALGIEPERIRSLPNSLDLDEFEGLPSPGPRTREATRVLYLGQLTPRKQVDVLVRALGRLPEQVSLEIAGGDGGCEGSLRRLVARLGLDSRVRFAGLLRGRGRLEALAAADVVSYAGRDEVFGLVALESLLCGTPVVVADDCGSGELVRRLGGGLCVPPGDDAALARALAAILAECERWREAARRAAGEVRRLFASDAVAAICQGVYEAVIQPGAFSTDESRG